MFSRILVPVDLSDRNGSAVDTAAELALASSGTVLVLHVIEPIDHVPRVELEDFYQGLRARASVVLDRLREQLERQGIPVETHSLLGKAGAEVVRFAEQERCDLAVMRSHALDPDHPSRGVGTTSHQVALAARCAVLLVR